MYSNNDIWAVWDLQRAWIFVADACRVMRSLMAHFSSKILFAITVRAKHCKRTEASMQRVLQRQAMLCTMIMSMMSNW